MRAPTHHRTGTHCAEVKVVDEVIGWLVKDPEGRWHAVDTTSTVHPIAHPSPDEAATWLAHHQAK